MQKSVSDQKLSAKKMVSAILSTAVSDARFSSVVPGTVTTDDKDREVTNLDLALKLHCVRGVYFFSSEAVRGLTIGDLKLPMFPWLALFPTASGRIRRSSDSGRLLIKCNDGGVRIVEADCCHTLEEWLSTNDHQNSLDDFLAHDQVLGPDLRFSPLVFIQFTWFRCGGLCVGLSWSHILGDPFSATTFINKWGQLLQDSQIPSKSHYVPHQNRSRNHSPIPRKPFSIKQVDPVGDCWTAPSSSKMGTQSIRLTSKQIDNIVSDVYGLNQQAKKISHFELVCAVIWKSLSLVREDSGPRIVTLCAAGNSPTNEHEMPRNDLVFSTVEADFSVAKADIYELAEMIAEKQEQENGLIEEMMKNGDGNLDCIMYGTNLTFVNLEEADVYGLEIKGHKPVYANYTIKGVGEEGAVLVLLDPDSTGSKNQDGGRLLTLIFPENQLEQLVNELRENWDLA